MATPADTVPHLADASKRLAQRALGICGNRLELLMVEVQEGRERILRAISLALGVAAFGLLAGVALTAAVVVAFWPRSPLIALLVLTGLYAAAAVLLYARLIRLQRDWRTLSTTLDQLRKDRECLGKHLNLAASTTLPFIYPVSEVNGHLLPMS
ncbi:MAG: phage holin family protein [Verrucomicrobiota bacterium]|jgi:uncharacterized membrane protein YqjE